MSIKRLNNKVYQATVGLDRRSDYICTGSNDSAKIQEAIDYVASLHNTTNGYGGGIVFIRSGVYEIDQTIILKKGVSIIGEGMRKTILKAKNGLNNDVVRTHNFALESNQQVYGYSTCSAFEISQLAIDGNANNQTGSGNSDRKDQYALLKIYGYQYKLSFLNLIDGVENGLYTEYEQQQTQAFNQYELFESTFHDLYIKTYRNVGWVMRGPHDSNINNCYVSTFETSPTFPRSHVIFETDSTKFFSYAGTVVNNLHTWGDLLHPYSTSVSFINDAAFVENGFFEGALIGYNCYIKNVGRGKFNYRTSYGRGTLKIESTGTGQYLKCEQNDIRINTVEQTPFQITNSTSPNRPMRNWTASSTVNAGDWIYNPTANLWYKATTAGTLDASILPTHTTGTVNNGTVPLTFEAYGVGADFISLQGQCQQNDIYLVNTSKYAPQGATILDLSGYTRTQQNRNKIIVTGFDNVIATPIRGGFPAPTDQIDIEINSINGTENATRNVKLLKQPTILAKSRGLQSKGSIDTSSLTLMNYTNPRSFPDIQNFSATEFTSYVLNGKLRANTPATTTANSIKLDFRIGSTLLGTINNIPIPANSIDRMIEYKAIIELTNISAVTPFCSFIINATAKVAGDNNVYSFIRRTTNGATAWTASSAVTLNQQIYNGNNYYVVTTAGTLGTVAPTHTAGTTANGTAQLTFVKTENAPLSVDLTTVKRIEPSFAWLTTDTTNIGIVESLDCTLTVNN